MSAEVVREKLSGPPVIIEARHRTRNKPRHHHRKAHMFSNSLHVANAATTRSVDYKWKVLTGISSRREFRQIAVKL
ncbi:hypothetical protein KCU73_g132, partial [Aureobasidium melanogenum]